MRASQKYLFLISLFLFSCKNCEQDHLIRCEQEEICDGIDNDCNGLIDDAFDSDKDGFTICQNDCNDARPDINPNSLEICNNFDDNCNQIIDENLYEQCWTGPDVINFSENSQCQMGFRECINGNFTDCQNQSFPYQNELCDGIDNDCNGLIDEPQYGICGPNDEVGVCVKGNQVCFGDETICVEAEYSSQEICDGLDNDCDGQTDENLKQRCDTICGIGLETCSGGFWVDCSAPLPIEEVCDGFDNNCDGQTDEGCQCVLGQVQTCKQENMINPVDNSTISCGIGAQICTMINKTKYDWGECIYIGTEPETCNNFDDDCSGQVDGFDELCGDLALDGIGECSAGTTLCEFGMWGECIGNVGPKDEVCDGLDNNCNFLIDEDLNPHEIVDIIFAIDGSGSMQDKIDALKTGISNYVVEFQGTQHQFGLVVFPGTVPNPGVVFIPLTDISTFQNSLNNLLANWGGSEPSYDVVDWLSRVNDPFGINWRPDAYPFIILIADEHAQTWSNRDVQTLESIISQQTRNCAVGSCVPGDRYEIYIISALQFYQMWNEIIFNESDRFFNIEPADASHYYDILYSILSNLCRN